jgi:FkbM family methyltransferase
MEFGVVKKFSKLFVERRWLPWFYRAHFRHLTIPSILRYRAAKWRRGTGKSFLDLKIKMPFKGTMRIRAGTSDEDTFWETVVSEVYSCVPRYIPKCEYILDLGANIGFATTYLCSRYPNAKVFAVEPHAHNLDLFVHNTRDLSEMGRCRSSQLAAWSETKILRLEMPSSLAFDSCQTSDLNDATVQTDCEEVLGVSIAELFHRSGFPRIDLIKIDIEGAECQVFKGDLGWLERTGALAIEFHGESRKSTRFDEVMEAHGFQVIDASGHHTTLAVKK